MLLANFGVLLAVTLLLPCLAWLLQGQMKSKRGGLASSFMDGFASVFETQQTRLQDAKREKQKGGKASGDPPIPS